MTRFARSRWTHQMPAVSWCTLLSGHHNLLAVQELVQLELYVWAGFGTLDLVSGGGLCALEALRTLIVRNLLRSAWASNSSGPDVKGILIIVILVIEIKQGIVRLIMLTILIIVTIEVKF